MDNWLNSVANQVRRSFGIAVEAELPDASIDERFKDEAAKLTSETDALELVEVAEILKRWAVRLEDKKLPAFEAVDAMLHSGAPRAAVIALARLRAGVAILKVAAGTEERSKFAISRQSSFSCGSNATVSEAALAADKYLHTVFEHGSPAPTTLVKKLLQLLAEATELTSLREDGYEFYEDIPSLATLLASQDLQWVLTLLQALLTEVAEIPIRRERLIAAASSLLLSVEQPVPKRAIVEHVWEEQFDRVEALGHKFRELRDSVEDLENAKRAEAQKAARASQKAVARAKGGKRSQGESSAASSAAPQASAEAEDGRLCVQQAERVLSSTALSLLTLRDNASTGPGFTERLQKNQKEMKKFSLMAWQRLITDIAAASVQVESLLVQRAQEVASISGVMAQYQSRESALVTLTLLCEKARRSTMEEILTDTHAALWGPDADLLIQDRKRVEAIRKVLTKAGNMAVNAWREMVGFAASTLGDSAYGQVSEDMSEAAARYKEMRKDIQSNIDRLAKLESDPPPARPRPAAPKASPSAPKAAPKPAPSGAQPAPKAQAAQPSAAAAAGPPAATRTAGPYKKAAREAAPSPAETQQAVRKSAGGDGKQATFRIEIDKGNGGKLGIDLDQDNLEITGVKPGGIVHAYNASCTDPSRRVRSGDTLVEVNGKRDPDGLMAEVRGAQVLKIELSRRVGSDGPTENGSGSRQRPTAPTTTTPRGAADVPAKGAGSTQKARETPAVPAARDESVRAEAAAEAAAADAAREAARKKADKKAVPPAASQAKVSPVSAAEKAIAEKAADAAAFSAASESASAAAAVKASPASVVSAADKALAEKAADASAFSAACEAADAEQAAVKTGAVKETSGASPKQEASAASPVACAADSKEEEAVAALHEKIMSDYMVEIVSERGD
eukprot:TRINITY_DN10964_c0_g3_i1.p1 TRINITY_DN10964_c0_g3~~TRINITY_DN10964_c0_g3_i1.p1  ORF type:complete len:907 (-),score=288.21 TRINITY_DN10964_c0_g3_i1:123-2843(-)